MFKSKGNNIWILQRWSFSISLSIWKKQTNTNKKHATFFFSWNCFAPRLTRHFNNLLIYGSHNKTVGLLSRWSGTTEISHKLALTDNVHHNAPTVFPYIFICYFIFNPTVGACNHRPTHKHDAGLIPIATFMFSKSYCWCFVQLLFNFFRCSWWLFSFLTDATEFLYRCSSRFFLCWLYCCACILYPSAFPHSLLLVSPLLGSALTVT